MIDISIKNLDNKLRSKKDYSDFLYKAHRIHEKYDGTKLTILRNNTEYDPDCFEDNWIVAYKGNIMFPHEFEGIDRDRIKEESVGISQYALVFDHLERVHGQCENVPKNTEFFVEFLMDKPTLTRDYHDKHALIYIDSGRVNWDAEFLQLTTERTAPLKASYHHTNCMELARPRQLAHNSLYPAEDLLGMSSKAVSEAAAPHVEELKSAEKDLREYYKVLKKVILSVPSEYGGKMEGVVITTDEYSVGTEPQKSKILQPDQHDRGKREQKKQRYKAEYTAENAYFDSIYHTVKESDVLSILRDHESVEVLLSTLSNFVYNKLAWPEHPKKNDLQVKDDAYLTAKLQFIKRLPGNNGGLFIGRFQPPTRAHKKIVDTALTMCDEVTVGIVNTRSDKSPFTAEEVETMWRAMSPEVNVIRARTGNLIRFIQKAGHNINKVFAGTDRVESYRTQLKRSFGTEVVEIERDDDGVSATKVRDSLKDGDRTKFEANMHPSLHHMYDHLRDCIAPNLAV